MTDEAYFLPGGTRDGAEVLHPTEHTGSPWTPGIQHGGPVAGLLWRTAERVPGHDDWRLARLAIELLGPIAIAELEVSAEVVRAGRSAELVEAEVRQRSRPGPDGEPGPWRAVARARGWRMRTLDSAAVAYRAGSTLPVPGPETPGFLDVGAPEAWRDGFVGSIEWRLPNGFGVPGAPTVAWGRMRMPLIAGEALTDTVRAVTVIDAANGVGSRLDTDRWTYINTELTIHLSEAPEGEWTGIEAESSIGSDGIGLSQAVVHDAHGAVGRIAQSLLVTPRAGTS